jgi:hypothetical protein
MEEKGEDSADKPCAPGGDRQKKEERRKKTEESPGSAGEPGRRGSREKTGELAHPRQKTRKTGTLAEGTGKTGG